MPRSAAQARGHPDVCHHASRLRSVLPQCYQKIRASTRNITPRERTRWAGRQVYFPSNSFAKRARFVFVHVLVLFALSLSRSCENQVTCSPEDCAKHQTKCTIPCFAQCIVLIGYPFLPRAAKSFDRRVR